MLIQSFMQISNPQALKGIFFSAFGFFCFSAGDAASKWLSASYEVLQVSFVFAVVSTIFFSALSPALGGFEQTLKTNKKIFHLARGVLNAAALPLAFYSFSQLPMTTVYTILFCFPFVVALISIPVFKDRIGVHRWAAIIVGFIGVLIAIRPGFVEMEIAMLACFALLLVVSFFHTISRALGDGETLLSLAFYPFLITAIACAPFVLTDFELPENLFDKAIFITGGLAYGCGVFFVSLSFRFALSAVAAPFQYTQIIWGVLFGVLLFGDFPDFWTLAGAAVIIASGVYLMIRESKAHEEKLK